MQDNAETTPTEDAQEATPCCADLEPTSASTPQAQGISGDDLKDEADPSVVSAACPSASPVPMETSPVAAAITVADDAPAAAPSSDPIAPAAVVSAPTTALTPPVEAESAADTPASVVAASDVPVAQTADATPVTALTPENASGVEGGATADASVSAVDPGQAGATGDVDMEKLLADAPPQATAQIKVGDRVSGVLVRVGDENSFIDFGGRSEGVLNTRELKGDDDELLFAVGEPLEAFVVTAGDEVRLTRFLKGEDREANILYKAFKTETPIEGRVMAVNKWGLGIELAGTRAFCPISQIDTAFVQNPEEYRDKTLQFKIIRFRDRGRSIVLSRRALLEVEQEKHAKEVRTTIQAGSVLTGKVTRLETFGAFVDLGHGVEGLVHVSEFKHERVGHPQEVVESGQEVKVKILDVKNLGSRRKERISLSMKALEADPWSDVREQFPQGSIADGKVQSLETYGAFIELAENVRGLVHVSEMADRRVNHPRDVVSVGDEVKVAVIELDNRRKRLRLSMRRVEQMEGEANLKEFADRQKREREESGDTNSAMFDALRRAQLID